MTYPWLDEPVAVTVLGRVIGHYIPGDRPPAPHEAPEADEPATPRTSPSGAVDALNPKAGMSQADKDKVLRRVTGGKG